MTRRCRHPHTCIPKGCPGLVNVPTTPLDGLAKMTLVSDGMTVPYCGADNERGLAAMASLGERMLRHRVVQDYFVTYHEKDDPAATDYCDGTTIPHLVLSLSLAEAEERYCVADWIKGRLAGLVRSA